MFRCVEDFDYCFLDAYFEAELTKVEHIQDVYILSDSCNAIWCINSRMAQTYTWPIQYLVLGSLDTIRFDSVCPNLCALDLVGRMVLNA
jgi:hypothetical protein